MTDLAQIAYEAYAEKSRELHGGDVAGWPSWEHMTVPGAASWRAAALAVAAHAAPGGQLPTGRDATVTPAQAACEAFWALAATGPDAQEPSAAWQWAASQRAQGAWDAAAEAAITAGTGRLLAEAARYKRERDELDAAYKTLDAQCEVHHLARQSAESQLAEVRRIAYQGGQDAASVRGELIAYLEGIK